MPGIVQIRIRQKEQFEMFKKREDMLLGEASFEAADTNANGLTLPLTIRDVLI